MSQLYGVSKPIPAVLYPCLEANKRVQLLPSLTLT